MKSQKTISIYGFKLLFISLFLIHSGNGTAQRIITNSTGEKIVMYPDGSWRMAEPGDSVLLKNSGMSQPLLSAEHSTTHPSVGNSGIDEELLQQWNDLYFNIKAQEKKVQGEFRAATNAQFKSGEQLSNAINNPTLTPEQIQILEADHKRNIRNLKSAKINQSAIRRIVEQAKKIANVSPEKLQQKMSQLRTRFNSYLAHYEPDKVIPTASVITREEDPKEESEVIKNTPSSDQKDESVAVNLRVPPGFMKNEYLSEPFRCRFNMDTVDAMTGRRRLELAPALLFTHTDPDLRPYFKDKELISCYGRFSKIDAYVYFTIEFQIASSHAQSNFGSLENGSLLRLKLLDGEYVSLYNIKADKGRIDPYSGYTVFTGQYALGKNEIKLLLSSELDKVRILWATGYEDYDVYKVSFFIDHLRCLMNP